MTALEGQKILHSSGSRAGSLAEAVDQTLAQLHSLLHNDPLRPVTEITADVGPLLQTRSPAEVVAIRVSPRPPADAFHSTSLPSNAASLVRRAIHVRGGHDVRGRELAPLGLEDFVAELPSIVATGIRNISITGVGSIAATAHEEAVADALLSQDSDMRITLSHGYFSNAFRDRDYTAILNSALSATGDELATLLERSCRRYFPSAALCYAKNDGGSGPLSLLSTTPVHGLFAEPAMRILGCATLTGVPDGEVILGEDQGVSVGLTRHGIPVASSLIRRGHGASLASNAAVHAPYTRNHLLAPDAVSVIADLRQSIGAPLPFGLKPTISIRDDVALVGCAAALLTGWIDRLESVVNEADLRRAQHLAEEDAQSMTVNLGAAPGNTRIIESSASSVAYSYPGIVRVRVRAAGTRAVADSEVK
ncbi:hydantoinase/oxoprolinase N-terminal domain-containing protein [Arthrobacter sp. VKM Ac-2550]|uniref:hydantoinase/oxoprolinase N-terminal domain-containing protein n=1 Tax=Crystallibacter permensis TaxID=1938888 RepID=UPI0022277EDB|nr:hydantoinase/oxoprolinase N-terminal domain-containing protein [Arthrobacter sp. VKM Ac-2550]MCW2132353.1 Hydantoinase/oxoprolinase N-terminal region [Arthrobacter sp. VKM Ac-2550]